MWSYEIVMVQSSFILHRCELDMLSAGDPRFSEMGHCSLARWVCVFRQYAIDDDIGYHLYCRCLPWGILFFCKMTRKEIFCSACVLVALNIVLGLFTYKMQRVFPSFALLWSELTAWDSIFSETLLQLGAHEWLTAIITWALPPYVFLLYGKKQVTAG